MQPPHLHQHGAWDGSAATAAAHQPPPPQQQRVPHLPQLGAYAPSGTGPAHASPQLSASSYYASATPSGSTTPNMLPHASPAPHAQQWAPRPHPADVPHSAAPGFFAMQPQPQPQPRHAAWAPEHRQTSQPGVPLKEEEGEGEGPAPLRRNQACLSCRKRKLRCDAVRPVCSTCARSKAAAAASNHPAPVPDGPCHYDDGPAAGGNADADSEAAARRERRKRRRDTVGEDERRPRTSSAGELRRDSDSSTAGGASTAPLPPVAMQPLSTSQRTAPVSRPGPAAPMQHGAWQQPAARPALDAPFPVDMNPRVAALQARVLHLEGLLAQARAESRDGRDSVHQSRAPSPTLPSARLHQRSRECRDQREAAGAVPIYSMLSPSSGREERLRTRYQMRPVLAQTIPAASQAASPPSAVSAAGSATIERAGSRDSGPSVAPANSATREEFSFDDEADGASIPGASKGEPAPTVAEPDPLLELLFPGWSPDLPPPDVVHALCRTFFARHPLGSMLYKRSFMASLSLPPRHPHRPHESLVHAILAAAAPLSPFFDGVGAHDLHRPDAEFNVPFLADARSRLDNANPRQMSFKEWHLTKARNKVERGLLNEYKGALDWVHAVLLITNVLWADLRFTEAFFSNAFLARAVSAAGLDKLSSRHDATADTGIFGEPASAPEEHERRQTMWWIYITDQINSGLPRFYEAILSDAAIQCELPVAVADFQAGLDPPLTKQHLASPDLFKTGHLDDFTLHIKSSILIKRVLTFCVRHHVASNPGRRPSAMRTLDGNIADFMASFPPTRFTSDFTSDRLVAHGNMHLASIYLHEHFLSSTDTSGQSEQRVRYATQQILTAVHELLAGSYDFGLLFPHIFVVWSVAGRMVAKEMERASRSGAPEDPGLAAALAALILALERAGEKSIKARRSAEMLMHVRAGLIPESALADLLYLDGVIPADDDDDRMQQLQQVQNLYEQQTHVQMPLRQPSAAQQAHAPGQPQRSDEAGLYPFGLDLEAPPLPNLAEHIWDENVDTMR